MRFRIATAMPMSASVKARPFGSDGVAGALQHPLRQGNVGRDHDVAGLHAFDDQVIGRIRTGTGGETLDQWLLGHADETCRHHGHGYSMA